MQQTNVLSFKKLKERISLEHVLRHYNLFDTLQLKGKSLRGPCPFCEGEEGTPFSVSLEKKLFPMLYLSRVRKHFRRCDKTGRGNPP